MSEIHPGIEQPGLGTGVRARRWRAGRKPPPLGALLFVVIGGVAFMAIFGNLIAPYDPSFQDVNNVLAKPSGAHGLGTDTYGRDVLSRLIVGTRVSVLGPAVIALGALFIGSLPGILAGYRGGWLDSVMMR